MRKLILTGLILIASGCTYSGHQPDTSVRHASTMAESSHPKPGSKRIEVLKSKAIDQRAKTYEKDGLSSENARAAAEIEYLKSGR